MHTMASPNDDELVYRQGVHMATLIHKSREKEPLTETEQQELNNWLNSNIANKTLFESLHNREQLSAEVKALLHYNENAAVAAIFKEQLQMFRVQTELTNRLADLMRHCAFG